MRSLKQADESKTMPKLSFSFQATKRAIKVALVLPVSPPVGEIITSSPALALKLNFGISRTEAVKLLVRKFCDGTEVDGEDRHCFAS
jgi:hypothetical protein